MKYDLIIVGGGVIGLLCAYEMAKHHLKIAVYDKQRCGQEASWAGAGICYPLAPWQYSEQFMRWSLSSQSYYKKLNDYFYAQQGQGIGWQQTGALFLTNVQQQTINAWQKHYNITSGQFLTASEINNTMGLKFSGYQHYYYDPCIAQIRNPWLLQCLFNELNAMSNVDIYTHEPVSSLIVKQNSVQGVVAGSRQVLSGSVVISAGAWSQRLLPTAIKHHYSIEPVQGQIIAVQTNNDVLKSILITESIYCVPRTDGLVLIGATVEKQGFLKTITQAAKESLYQSACALLPKLQRYPVKLQWAGLRPWAPQAYVGADNFYKGLYIAAGHYRCGLTTAPATVQELQQMMLAA